MRRFYRNVTPKQAEGGYTVLLDDRPVRTPARRPLVVPTAALAQGLAGEWEAQEDQVRPLSMPLTRFASTVIDRGEERRAQLVDELTAYAETDLLCYRAETPGTLADRQHATWQPLLDWATRRYDAPLRVTSGVAPVAQPEAARRALRAAVTALDDWRLIGLHAATTALGSLVLGLAVLEDVIDAEGAFAASQLDETFQAEQWGEDEEAVRRREALRGDVRAAAVFLALAKG